MTFLREIAVCAAIERFIRSMKTECCGHILEPFRLDAMREELACCVTWYNQHRPHRALARPMPDEVHRGETLPGPPVQFGATATLPNGNWRRPPAP